MSGHLKKPGVFELPIGITFRQVIDEVCGGTSSGKRVKAVIPGGSSMPPLDPSAVSYTHLLGVGHDLLQKRELYFQ